MECLETCVASSSLAKAKDIAIGQRCISMHPYWAVPIAEELRRLALLPSGVGLTFASQTVLD